MATLKISARGLDLAIAKLNKNAALEIAKIDSIMQDKIKEAEQAAKANLPAQYGELKASISSNKIKELNYQLRADKDYAAYVEFGTGRFAADYVISLEPEWEKLAATFIETREGKMEEEPYFYPAVQDMWKSMLEEIKKATNARYK